MSAPASFHRSVLLAMLTLGNPGQVFKVGRRTFVVGFDRSRIAFFWKQQVTFITADRKIRVF